jgi:hypothetical protein
MRRGKAGTLQRDRELVDYRISAGFACEGERL